MIPRREPRQQKSTKRTGHKVVFILGTVLLVGICTVAMLAGLFMMYVRTTLAPTLEVNADDYTMNLSSIIYYQDRDTGDWVEYQTVYGTENRIWVDYEQIPDALWQAAVAIEDHRFFEHNGVDWTRTASATLNFFTGSRATFGGSTLTQQVLKNMTGDDGNTINRKVREIFRALEFEKNYTKQEILEMYLNTIYLGQGCYGVQTASEFYFGKDVSELDPAECACLIAITNNPSLYGPMSTITITREDGSTVTPRELNKERQEMILTRMAGGNDDVGVTGLTYLTEEEAEAAKAEELHFTDGTTSAQDIVTEATGGANVNSWFVDQVLRDVSADLADLYGITEKRGPEPDLQQRLQHLHHAGPEDSGDCGVCLRGPGESEQPHLCQRTADPLRHYHYRALHRQHRGHGGRYGTSPETCCGTMQRISSSRVPPSSR